MQDKICAGQKFGKWTTVSIGRYCVDGDPIWHCVCECGRKGNISETGLRSIERIAMEQPGLRFGCGHCHNKIGMIKRADTHYRSTYRVWHNMKRRCLDADNPGYKNYGGRGIGIYTPWIKDFRAFYEYVSKLEHYGEPGRSIDRINNDGNYEPGNLRWATAKEQCNNKRQRQKKT